MLSRLALGLLVLGLASQASASLLFVDYDFSNGGTFALGGQTTSVAGGTARFDFHGGGQTTLGGTIQPGPAAIVSMDVVLGGTLQLRTNFSMDRWRFQGQQVLGSFLDPSLRPDGGVQIFPNSNVAVTVFSPGGAQLQVLMDVQFGFADNRLLSNSVKYQSLGGVLNPPFSFFAGGQEVARSLPEPSPGALLAAAGACLLASLLARRAVRRG